MKLYRKDYGGPNKKLIIEILSRKNKSETGGRNYTTLNQNLQFIQEMYEG